MISMLADIESSFKKFFIQLTSSLGFTGLFIIALAVELFIVFLFVLKTGYAYELRLKRSIDKLNNWLFVHKKLDQSNIKEFNDLVKKGPKRLAYYWQQYILFREKDPTFYLSMENLIEKPLRTSSFANNIKNLNIISFIWSGMMLVLGIAYQANSTTALTAGGFMAALLFPLSIMLIGLIAAMLLKGKKTSNLDEMYHIYHIFARFIANACVDLPSYIDYDLLFTSKEIEKGNPQLREYYESRARKAKEEFERAKQSDIEYVEYNFENAGVDGSLVLERAMKETETFINKKTNSLAKIAHVDAQKEALKRNNENVQKDLQKKIQASKENINKLIQQQEGTTNRMEVGFLRKQQEQEISKQESLQSEYDQEETRFAVSNEELQQEINALNKELEEAKKEVQKAMVAEYQSFYEKVMTKAYKDSEGKVVQEKTQLKKDKDSSERELIIVQTQIKRLVDENNILRKRLKEYEPDTLVAEDRSQQGKYDDKGNFVYEDGSYHDSNGLFHDIDGKIYDMNGTLIGEPSKEELNDDAVTVKEMPQQLEIIEAPTSEENIGVVDTLDVVSEENEDSSAASKRRGRPRKVVVEAEVKVPKKRGRPKKEEGAAVTEEIPVATASKKLGAGRPKGSTAPKATASGKAKPATKSSAVTAKSPAKKDLSLSKLNKMITDEEKKLSQIKSLIGDELSEAISGAEQKEIDQQRATIIKSIDELKAKAAAAKANGESVEEIAMINNRIEALINEISELNKKD